MTEADTPVVTCSSMLLLSNPSNRDLAERIGILHPLEQAIYDLVVVGAGPAGLAAAVYGASEGTWPCNFADHRQPVKYEMSLPPEGKQNLAGDLLYIHQAKGRQGRHIDDSTEQFVEATRTGTAI